MAIKPKKKRIPDGTKGVRSGGVPTALGDFADEFTCCWACGWGGQYSSVPRRLEIHHIMKPGRSNVRPNLSRLCSLCHKAAEGERVILNRGIAMPPLRLPAVLWLKAKHDPLWYNRQVLRLLSKRAYIPYACRPHRFYVDSYMAARLIPSWNRQQYLTLAKRPSFLRNKS